MKYNPHWPDWHKASDIPPDITLEEYAAAWKDMAPHVEHLREYASGKSTIVEFGLRGAVSTWAMLDAMAEDGHLIGVDIDSNPPLPPRVLRDERFELRVGDSVKVKLPKHADLVMIDSSHEFTQTVLELVRAATLTPDVILCHDYLYRHTPHVKWAIDGWTAEPYTEDHWPQVPYRLDTVHKSEWGLAVMVPR